MTASVRHLPPAPMVSPSDSIDWSTRTFGDALAWGAQVHADREALVHDGERLTFAALAARARAFAHGLLAIGVQPGEKVALWMSDRVEWMVARWAVPLIGAVLLPVNTRLRAADLEFMLSDSGAATLILEAGARGVDYVDLLAGMVPDAATQRRGDWHCERLPSLRRVVLRAGGQAWPGAWTFAALEHAAASPDLFEGTLPSPHELAARIAAVHPTDIAQILYTSGTTSRPKGALLRHGALLRSNQRTIGRMRLTPADRYLSSVPLFTATGTGYTLSMWLAGAAIVVLDRFEPGRWCEAVERERITVGFFVDTIVADLRASAEVRSYDLRSLRTGTGVPLSTGSFLWLTHELGIAGLTGVYGMSETANAAARGDCADSLEKRSATCGKPVDGIDMRIVDVASGAPLAVDEVGEICVRGAVVMTGYLGRPDEDAKAFDADGWFHTGDLGALDADGYLVFKGRLKEMIKPAGFNVGTLEIESFLKTFPGVREAVVVGVPDARLVEVAYAFIEPEPGTALDTEALLAHCRASIASYKVPRYVTLVEDWPRTGSGKIQALQLRDRACAGLLDAGATS